MARPADTLSTKELEELLGAVDQTMDRLKTLYEQYFMGIQKQAPAFVHSDVERKLRDLTQMNIRNTGLRYRLATLQQKFGAYNSYWRRTLRQIENGTYIRNLAKLGRDAARTGAEIPEEILAKMPKRMREQVLRDRDEAIAIAKRRKQLDDETTSETAAPDFPPAADDVAAMISEPSVLRRELKTRSGAHIIDEDDDDLDFETLFAAFNDDAPKAPTPAPAPPPQTQRLDPTSTQAITRPLSKMPTPAVPQRTPPTPTTQPTTALPRVPQPAQSPPPSQTSAIPRPPTSVPRIPTGPVPVVAPPSSTGSIPRAPQSSQLPVTARTGPVPRVPAPGQTGGVPRVPPPTQPIPRPAPSQQSRPNPIQPGAAARTGSTPVESMSGPFPRSQPPPVTQAVPKITPPARPTPTALRPPPGMTEADVNALHAKYVKAKQAVGEKVDASSREKLLRTINQTAPKIMQQYKASGVDFSVVVKDNQVVIKAKPKT